MKALMLYKFPYINGLDESFITRVLLLVNLGIIFLSQIASLYLGGLYESFEFQIMSGELFSFHDIFFKDLLSVEVKVTMQQEWQDPV